MAKPFRASVTGSSSLPLVGPVAMLALLMSPQCRAEWKIVPSVELRETYTDNVRLEPDATKRGTFVTELIPTLSIANEGPRLKLHALLATNLYAYSEDELGGTNRVQRRLAADARAKLIENLLFVDASASISPQSISAFGPQAGSSDFASANRADVRTYQVSPYLLHRFGSTASAELRYAYNSVEAGKEDGLGDSTGNTVSMSISSGAAFRTVGWTLQYNRQELDDSLAGQSNSQTAAANLRLRLSPTFSLTTNVGYDKYDYQPLGGTTAGRSYSLGFGWQPSGRTSIEASAGKRFFGSTYALDASHRSRHTVWSANYNDDVTTSRSQFLLPSTIDTAALINSLFSATIPDPAARQLAVEAYLRATGLPPSLADNINYFSNRFFRQKLFQVSAAFNTAKTTTVVAFNATKRTALSTAQSDSTLLGSSLATLNDDTRQVGATVTANYRLNSRSGVTLTLRDMRNESLSTGIKDHQKSVNLAITRQLQRKLKGAVELRRNQGNAAIQAGRTYRENAISASLSLTL